MRQIAFFADIHANLPALRAVMEDRVENARPALLAYLDSHWAQDG